ncbi:MAG: zinc-binding dehydrogenase [SAR202 cluster bacterium]|nr:zinc-binding dehydrogenase [SAR202 cluster bacterium]|tara:strand:+ start:818 stop:1909 length:1092 start_codon:yes stop_codon:yes gene_type:complete
MSVKCLAAVFVGAELPLEIQEFPVPEIGPENILVKMNMAAVCGTDAHNWYNPKAPNPIIWGHENIGQVASLGSKVSKDILGEKLKEGDRILFHSAPCGHCYNCVMGLRCTNNIHYGNSHVDPSSETMLRGGFGQYLLLDPNPAVIKVPDDMTTERALMSVIGNHTTMSGLRKINGPDPGDTVVIQGCGPIGMGALIQSKLRGAAHVIMIGSPSHRLGLAKELGADETIDLSEFPTPESRIEKVRDLTGRGPDMVIEASGAKTSVHEGFQMVRYGGKYLVIGLILPVNVEMDPSLIASKDLTVAGVVGSKVENIIRSMRLMQSRIDVPIERMITHQYPLSNVNEALQSHVDLSAMVPVVNHSLI